MGMSSRRGGGEQFDLVYLVYISLCPQPVLWLLISFSHSWWLRVGVGGWGWGERGGYGRERGGTEIERERERERKGGWGEAGGGRMIARSRLATRVTLPADNLS